MRIVLHSINFIAHDGNYDMGTLLLKASLAAAWPEVEVEIIQSDYFDDIDVVANQLAARAPDLIGFSVAIWSKDRMQLLIERCSALEPRPIIVCGGHGTRFIESEFLADNPAVEVVVCGDGEITFAELVGHYLEGRRSDLGKIPGIVFRDGDDLHATLDRQELLLLSEVSSPHSLFRPPRFFGYLSQRFCPFHCRNCTWQFRNHPDNQRTLTQVREDLAWAIDNGYRDIRVWDSSLNIDSARFNAVLDFVDQLDERLGLFWGYLKYELLSAAQLERLAAFRRGKLTAFNVAAESFAAKALRLINRKHDLDKFRAVVEALAERRPDFRIVVQMMLGLPGDDIDTFLRALDYLETIPNALVNVNPLVVVPGTIFAERAAELGLVFEGRGVPFLRSSHDFSERDLDRAYEHIDALGREGRAMVHPLSVPIGKIDNPEAVPDQMRAGRQLEDTVFAGVDGIADGRVRIRGAYRDALRGEAAAISDE